MKDLLRRYSQVGFTLVEVMLSIGISSVVALIVAKVMESGQKEFKRIEVRTAVNNIHQTITSAMQDSASCSETIRSVAPAAGVSAPATGIAVDSIKRCKRTLISDIDADGYTEVTCDASNLLEIYKVGEKYSNNTVEIESILYKDDIDLDGNKYGPRIEVTYNVLGTGTESANAKKRVAGIRQIKKDSILLQVSYNQSNIFECKTDISSMMNATVEQSCQGNNAFLDKTQEQWKCYHEVDLPECDPGMAIVAVIGSSEDQTQKSFNLWSLAELPGGSAANSNTFSQRLNPSKAYDDAGSTNNKAVTFQCVNITPVNSSCDDGDNTTLDLTVITGPGTDLVTDFYASECVHVPNCGLTNAGSFYHLAFNNVAKDFECVEKKCSSANQIAITTEFGEKCITCPAGSVIVKIATDPGFKCASTGCDDTSVAGTSQAASEANVQKYFTGRWDSNGDPVCRDLITTDGMCTNGGSLKVGSDGSVRWECCPICDSSFNSEKANVCYGQTFTASNGCTLCDGTKSLQAGCPNQLDYCPGTNMGTSDCGEACNPGTKPVSQGTLSSWSNWSTCTTSSTTSTRTRTCDGSACGGNCNGADLSETQDCTLYDVDADGGTTQTFANCTSAGGEIIYVSRTGDTNCIGYSDSILNQYMNSSTPQCVPLCFFDVTPTGIRGGGISETYTNQGCSYNEVTSSNFLKDCPSGYARFKGFSSATQTSTCPCCETNIGGCSLNNASCTDGGPSYPGWSYVNRTTFAGTIGGSDKKAYPSGNGNSCQVNTVGFQCFATLTKVGCGF